MSLVGRLEDLSLGEILQIVSLSKRSGLLRLEGPEGKASLYIRSGKVIYAATSDEQDDVLSLLVKNNLIDAGEIRSFGEKLESTSTHQEAWDLIEERTGVGRAPMQEILKNRVENLTYSLFIWESGTFSFQLIEDERTHPVLAKAAPFFLEEGIGAQYLVMEGARRKDEMLRDTPIDKKVDDVPMVDPSGVLGDDWEKEFEQHLSPPTEGTGEKTAEGGAQQEIEEFIVPETLPVLPEKLSNKVVAVGLQPSLVVDITGGFVRAGVDLLVHENGANALTNVQELRQQAMNPYMLVDLEAAGITDDRILGGLEIISTMWDFGFHLPVGLVYRKEMPEELRSRLGTVPGLSIIHISEPPDKTRIQEIVEIVTASIGLGSPLPEKSGEAPFTEIKVEEQLPSQDIPVSHDVQAAAAPKQDTPTDRGEEYYDIQQEFSEELGDIDLPLEDWDEGQAPPRDVSSDPHMARLSSYVNELNRQDISGEITLLALRFASAFVNRAILFLLRKDDIKGLGQFGVDLGQERDPDRVVRSLNLPLQDDSVFQRVAIHRQSYKGPTTGSGTENALFEALGGGVPTEIFIGPIVSMGKVAVLLYGDDFPTAKGLEPTHTLDIFLSHVGLALDRAFLEMKLRSQKS